MSSWGNKDLANNSPRFATFQAKLSPSDESMSNLYANTTIGAFVSNEAVGVYGVNSAEASAFSTTENRVTHSGWNLRTVGTGPVESIDLNVAPAQYKYSNGYVIFTGTNSSPANAQVIVDGTGNVIDVVLNSGGAGYVKTPTAVANGSANNANLTFIVTMGGRANRVQTETLATISEFSSNVAHGSLY